MLISALEWSNLIGDKGNFDGKNYKVDWHMSFVQINKEYQGHAEKANPCLIVNTTKKQGFVWVEDTNLTRTVAVNCTNRSGGTVEDWVGPIVQLGKWNVLVQSLWRRIGRLTPPRHSQTVGFYLHCVTNVPLPLSHVTRPSFL